MKRFRVSALAAASCLSATVLLAGCSGSSDLAVQNPQIQPTVDANGEVAGGVQNPVNTPGVPASGEAGEGLPNVIDASQAPVPGKGAPSGYSAKQLKSAFQWAAAVTQQRYMLSGFWTDEVNRPGRDSTTYYGFMPLLDGAGQSRMEKALLTPDSIAAEQEWLDSLVPYPPNINGMWLAPAVSDFAIGKPKYAETPDGLVVTFPYSAYGAYVAKDMKTFFALLIQEKVSYTLVPGPSKEQPWALAGWNTDVKVGAPEKLDSAPVSRVVPDYSWIPDGDTPIDIGKDPNAK